MSSQIFSIPMWHSTKQILPVLTFLDINMCSVTQISVLIPDNDTVLEGYFTLNSSAGSDWFIGPWRMCGALCCCLPEATWDLRPGWPQSAGFMGVRETEGDQITQVNNLPLVLDFTPPACAHQKADSVNTTGAVFMEQWEVSFGCEPQGPSKTQHVRLFFRAKTFERLHKAFIFF